MEKELYILEEKPTFSLDVQRHKEAGQIKIIKKIASFLRELQEEPTQGTGQVERLKHYGERSVWSRRIDQKHRLVYEVFEEEKRVIRENLSEHLPIVTPVTSADDILEARSVVREVYIDEKIEQYIADIVFATRYPERYDLASLRQMITFGGSPRASINLAKAARAYAFIKRRGYVVPEDVRAVAHDVLRHRIGLSYEAEASNVNTEGIVSDIINKVQVP